MKYFFFIYIYTIENRKEGDETTIVEMTADPEQMAEELRKLMIEKLQSNGNDIDPSQIDFELEIIYDTLDNIVEQNGQNLDESNISNDDDDDDDDDHDEEEEIGNYEEDDRDTEEWVDF